jgi:hypothetical protein
MYYICGLWPPDNVSCIFLTWYQSKVFFSGRATRPLTGRRRSPSNRPPLFPICPVSSPSPRLGGRPSSPTSWCRRPVSDRESAAFAPRWESVLPRPPCVFAPGSCRLGHRATAPCPALIHSAALGLASLGRCLAAPSLATPDPSPHCRRLGSIGPGLKSTNGVGNCWPPARIGCQWSLVADVGCSCEQFGHRSRCWLRLLSVDRI